MLDTSTLDQQIASLTYSEAEFTKELDSANTQLATIDLAVAKALGEGDHDRVRNVRTQSLDVKALIADREGLIADIRASLAAAKIERVKIDQAAAAEAKNREVESCELAIDGAADNFNAALLATKSALVTVQNLERQRDRLLLEREGLRAALRGGGHIERPPAPRPHKRLEMSAQLHQALERG